MSVRETNTINIEYNPVSGRKMLNRYEIYGEIGRGQHGKVKLGKDLTDNTFVAIKTVDRKDRPRLGRPSTSTSEAKVRQEIAILKKCKHPNIVELLEVLDDSSSRKIYLVLQYLEKGEVKWQTPDQRPALTPDRARKVIVDTLMGLEYLHSHGIIHRDIKPANLLLSGDDVVKISDFGVSYAFTSQACDDLEMAKTVGSPAFFAPEMCIFDESGTRPRITGKIDVWALGVTLYCLIYGHLPFDAENEYELFRVISKQPLHLPPAKNREYEQINDLLSKLLEKDPEKRLDITQIRYHPWLRDDIELAPAQPAKTRVSEEEVNHAVRGIASRIKSSFNKLVARSRSHSRSDPAGSPTNTSIPVVNHRAGRDRNVRDAQPKSTAAVPEAVPAARLAPQVAQTAPEAPAIQSPSTSPKLITSEPVSGNNTPKAQLPHIASSPGRINLPQNIYPAGQSLRCTSEDTLNNPNFRALDSDSDSSDSSDSDEGQLTLVIGRKRSPVQH